MRILIVSNGFPPSGQWGTEFYTHQLATGLLRAGHQVAVLHPERGGERTRYHLERCVRYGVDVFELTNPGDPDKRFEDSYENAEVERIFAELLHEWRPDVVHLTHMLWGLSARLPCIARDLGVATVVTATDFGLLCHRGQFYDWRLRECKGPRSAELCARCVREPGAWDGQPLELGLKRLAVRSLAALGGMGRVVTAAQIRAREAAMRACMSCVDHWIMPTQALGREFLAAGLPADRIDTLVYGLDEQAFARPRVAPDEAGFRFAYMSQFMPHKGLSCLLDAARLLAGRLPESVEPWRIDLYGNGTFDRHRRYAEHYVEGGLPRRVHHNGPFEPLRAPEILARTDAVLVPSRWRENAPLTVLQARAAGVPVIASDVDGVREVLEDGRHGLLFPAGDAVAMASAMGELICGRRVFSRRPDPAVRWDEHLASVHGVYELVRGVREARVASERRTLAGSGS